jgi:hypothetical protein
MSVQDRQRGGHQQRANSCGGQDRAGLHPDHLMSSCPGLHVLATSRQALGVAGEVRIVVPSMSLPSAGEWQPPSGPAVAAEPRVDARPASSSPAGNLPPLVSFARVRLSPPVPPSIR